MQKITNQFIIILLLVFSLLISFKYFRKEIRTKSEISSSYQPLDMKLVKESKPFLIVIPSFNNEAYVEKNLSSVFTQEYENYRVVYIDDASTDKTFEKVTELVRDYHKECDVTLIRNTHNHKALYNLYYAIQTARPEEIVVLLDGDDWFPHTHVLQKLNRYYNDDDVWLTYGQYVTYPKYERGSSREPFFNLLKKGSLRGLNPFSKKTDWNFSHLRTFYAGLFQRVHMKDLLHEGQFFSSAWDLAIMFPMLEMAASHAVFIPEVLYIYNRETALNDDKIHREEQIACNRLIRTLSPYPKLYTHPKEEWRVEEKTLKPEVVIFSKDRPMQLYGLLESFKRMSKGFSKVYVLIESSNSQYVEGYKIVKDAFQDMHFFLLEKEHDVRFVFSKLLDESSSHYVVLGRDDLILKEDVDWQRAAFQLEKTGAYAAFFHLGLNVENLPKEMLPLEGGLFLWDLSLGEKEWRKSNQSFLSLYRKSDLKNFLAREDKIGVESFLVRWDQMVALKEVALCPKLSSVVRASLQITDLKRDVSISLYLPEELNQEFLEGKKIDLKPIYEIENRRFDVEYYPRFIPRRDTP